MNVRQRKKHKRKAGHHSFLNFRNEVINNYSVGLLWNGESWYLNADMLHQRYMTSIHMLNNEEERENLKKMYIEAFKAHKSYPTKILGKRLYK